MEDNKKIKNSPMDSAVRRPQAALRSKSKLPKAKWLKLIIVFLVAVGVLAGIFILTGMSKEDKFPSGNSGIFTVRRDNLVISVVESGDIKALNSKDIKSEVEGRTTIISIIDEGTFITEEDVNNGKILVELDSSDIKEKLTQQEVSFLSAESNYTDANESLDIQIKQNDSDIKGGKMKVKFALMDFKKYVGQAVAEKIVELSNKAGDEDIDIIVFLEDKRLGGEASQKLKELRDNILLAEEKYARADDKLEWTKKLKEKNYVSENELKGDELEKQSLEIQKEKSGIALKLFNLYEFPKETEKRLADYEEAKRELERTQASARSKLAKAQARLNSNKATYLLRKERLEKLQKQLLACTIKAPTPGQVVYSSSMNRWERRNRPIEIGAEIGERQRIILIPDLSQMKVEIKIHEMWIDKIKIGQKAEIAVPAFPDMPLTGEVIRKAPLADQQGWLNPDLKVYVTDVSIEGTHDCLKTGMTARVEVIINELKDVINVPIQSVVERDGKKVCFMAKGSNQREVEIGEFNNDFIEIKDGLQEGEKILLNPPRIFELDKSK